MDKGKINQSTTSSDRISKALEKYAELMITRMEELQKDWEKGWTDGVHGRGGLPQNISGRSYLGSNAFLLYLHTARHHYAAPVYMTIKQIRDTGATIKKGESSVPVFKWGLSIKDENKKRVSEADYKNMTPEEQEKCKVIPYLQVYNEWNIDQTNLVDVNKEKYDTLLKRFEVLPLKDDTGMYKCAALDRMFERQEWVCPIEYQNINASAYYSVTKDEIVVPRKSQFNIHDNAEDIYKDGMEYYSSALHEMAHSTGHKDRLNRANNTTFGSKEYGKEELVAELTASLVGSSLGFDCRIQENNAAYLKSWISSLREEPKFILTVMSDVNKASKMVIESIDKQRMALGETPLIQGSLDVVDEKVKKEEDPKETVAQEWASLDEKPTIKMESGDVLPVEYNKENDTLDVQITNEDGKQEVYSTNYDHDRNIQENLGHLWEELSNMKDYVESIKDKNDIMSGNFELLPSDSKVGKLYKDVLHLSKEYDKFTKNPSEYDYEDRAGLYADIESVNLSFHAELQKQVESFKNQSQPIHEDSNVKTDVVSKTKEIIATGVPMNDAEKIAKNMVDAELAKQDKERSEEETEDKKRNEKKFSDEQNKKTEQTVSEEQDNPSPTMRAVAHTLLLVGALEAAQKSDGVWMNKGQKQGAEFVNSHTPISAYNNMMMVLYSDKNEYKTNVYTYYNPAKDNNMPVRRSQAALPFSWTTWDYQNVADKSDIISKAEYNKLPEAERSKYKKHASKEFQNIYNIDQTTMSSTNKESYASFVKDKGVKLQSLHAESMSFAQHHASQKEKHPDAIILMRTGDFYTTYNEDAKVASNVLGITLTRTSDKTSADGKKILMAGFPNHALDTYLPKLIRAGHRVAICDKVETNPQKVTSEASRIFDHAVEQAKNVSKMTGMKVQRSGLSSTVNYSVADDRFLISSKKLSTISPYEEATDRAAKIYRGLVEAVNKEDRLNISSRISNLPLAPKEYEKLVVELSAGTIMSRLGLPAKIDKENIDIIPTWTKAIKENPKLVGVIERDVNTTVETIEKLSMNQSVDYAAIRGEAAKSDKADIAIEQHDSYKVKINTFQAIKDDAGHYAFFIKAQDEQSFSVYPQKEHMSTYFNVLKTPERAAVHEALAHKYYELATKYPEMKHDLITPKQVDVDKSLINKVSITSSAQDPKVKLIFVNINGKRDSAVVSPSQWQKMWLADDMASYKRDLAAVLFEQKIRQEMNKGQDNKMEETSSRGFHR